MDARTRLLIRHFVRGYLSTDLTGGERHAALAAALLVSPGLFTIVLMSSKYVITPFPTPGHSALAGFADRMLIFGASTVIMMLVAVVQWDRLSLDARDASILGVLPLRYGKVVRAKWAATAVFAGAAAIVLNGPPSMIYPLMSVGRLQADWLLVLHLTTLQLAIGVLSGVLGFLVVLTVREALLAMLGAGLFARVSPAVQASFVVVGLVALFLQAPFAQRALSDGHQSTRWLPAILLAGTFEELGGYRVAGLPAAPLPARVAARAEAVLDQYRQALGHASGSARRTAAGACGLCVVLATALLWNTRRQLDAPVVDARGTRVTRAWARLAWRAGAPRPETRAGATFACRTLMRSQPHRLLLAAGLAVGLAAGALGMSQEPRPGTSLAETDLALLSIQGLVLACVAAGVWVALRRPADSRAAWLFAVAWDGVRAPYEAGVVMASRCVLISCVLLMAPLWWSLLGATMASTHAMVGMALALALAELIVLTLGTVALVEEAVASDSTRALPVLGVPAVVIASTILATAERWSVHWTVGVLLVLAVVLRAARRYRGVGRQTIAPVAGEPSAALSLNE